MSGLGREVFRYVIIFTAGSFVTVLFLKFGLISGPISSDQVQIGPHLDLNYADFVTIILTAVTVVLTALAITIGVVAAYTVREIKNDARGAAEAEIASEMEGLNDRIKKIVEEITFQTTSTSGDWDEGR